MSVAAYDEEQPGEPVLLKPPEAAGDGNGFLIIDDLVDRGATAKLVRGLLPRAHFACLYAKPSGRPFTDTFVLEVAQETWILFPWDTAPLFVPPIGRVGPPRLHPADQPRADRPFQRPQLGQALVAALVILRLHHDVAGIAFRLKVLAGDVHPRVTRRRCSPRPSMPGTLRWMCM